MRKDIKFVQNQLMPFLKGMFKDAKESGKSFYKYFGTELSNKKTFKNSKELYKFKYGANSLFENDTEAEKGFDVLVDELFARMQREFHYGTHKLYTPDENGNFNERQEKALFELSNNLIDKVNFKEVKPPISHDKIINETSYRLGFGRLNIVEPLHFNEETGLIEGRVVNINDPTGAYLNVKIDPVDPEMIYFEDDSGKIKFALKNTDRDMLPFQKKNSEEIMNTAKPEFTELPEFQPSETGVTPQETIGLPPETPFVQPKSAFQQEEFKLQLPEISIEEKTQTQVQIQGQKGQARRLPTRVTEGGLKTYEKERLVEKASGSATAGLEPAAPKPINSQQTMPKIQEGEPEEEQNKKKKGSIGKKIAAIATGGLVGGGGIIAGLISMDIV
jgi:hypothetical protein